MQRRASGALCHVQKFNSAVLIPQIIEISYTFIFHKQFHFAVSSLKITGHGNHDNNLESARICKDTSEYKYLHLYVDSIIKKIKKDYKFMD
jgi:hypothetical protein